MLTLIASFSSNVQIAQLQDDKEPFTDDEDMIETYDNQRLVRAAIYCYRMKLISYQNHTIMSNAYWNFYNMIYKKWWKDFMTGTCSICFQLQGMIIK